MADQTRDSLESNPVLQDSMMFRLIQVSERARNLSDGFKSNYDNIPWTAVYGFRNRIVHDYGNAALEIVFNTLKNDIIEVRKMIEKI